MKLTYRHIADNFNKVNWTLLIFLLLVLNVKLIIKIAALILFTIYLFRSVSRTNLLRQRLLLFYFSLVGVGVINLLLQSKGMDTHYAFTAALGIGIWMLAAAASYLLFLIVEKGETEKLYNAITVFFVLHIAAIFTNLARIMIECGSLNPYMYKGLNQKYYISTGDHIPGITFDGPVVTALISAFALVFFLYRRQFLLSLAATASLALIGSNLTNIFLGLVLLFIFVFRSDRVQKSFIIIQCAILITFLARISPKDNEYLGRVVYNIIGKPYDLPKRDESIDFIKTQPDSLLDITERKRKKAQLYIDRINYLKSETNTPAIASHYSPVIQKKPPVIDSQFYEFRVPASIKERISKSSLFIEQHYAANERDSLAKIYNWKKPGKWIAYLELYHFLKEHPSKILLGTGIGNFSSRTAFKVTALNISGAYPAKYSYIHPWFRANHLYVYLNYHSQDQMKHAAANTPDSAYSQLLGEYGIIGLLFFFTLYIGYFVRHLRRLTFALPLLLLLIGAFAVEYLFEQLSIVILFEALFFLDIKGKDQKSPVRREEPLT